MSDAGRIRSFDEIPDVLTMEVPAVEYVVPALGIYRNSITLWTGTDGDGKTYLAQAMTAAIAKGGEFLGMTCQKSPVLYLDLENPVHVVKDRFQAVIGEANTPNFRVWGIWNQQQPPQYGNPVLLSIAQHTKPVIIIDPFRYFHGKEENDSTEMSAVMQYLRACAGHGCAVIILHHPAKTEGSTGRGSSAIRGACDLAFLHSLDKNHGLITLKVDKNRNGESRTITIRADFEEGRFEVVDAPYITRRNDELRKIADMIKQFPGQSQNALWKQSGIMKSRFVRLLKEGRGTHWTESRDGSSLKYYPLVLCSQNNPEQQNRSTEGCSTVLSPLGENREQPEDQATTLPSCKACGSFALYRDGTCMTCDNEEKNVI